MKQQRLRILICDTDVETLIDLEQMLEDAGFDTTTTWDAMDVDRLLERDLFHLLIMGNHPPQMDAEVMLRRISARDRWGCGVLSLVLLRDLTESEMERLRSAGATAVLSRQDYAAIVERAQGCLRDLLHDLRKAG
jgi:CheY-like chemotaxis protein